MNQKEHVVHDRLGRAVASAMKEGFLEPMRMMGMGSKTRWGKLRWGVCLSAMMVGLACVPLMMYDQVGVDTIQDRVEVLAVNIDDGLMGSIVPGSVEMRILGGAHAGTIISRSLANAEEFTPGQELVMEYKSGRLLDTIVLVDLSQPNPGH